MKATIDAAGRIVVPKPLRQALGLKPGQPLEIRAGDGRLEIEITPVRAGNAHVRMSVVSAWLSIFNILAEKSWKHEKRD